MTRNLSTSIYAMLCFASWDFPKLEIYNSGSLPIFCNVFGISSRRFYVLLPHYVACYQTDRPNLGDIEHRKWGNLRMGSSHIQVS